MTEQSPFTHKELFRTVVGDWLGGGVSRRVYAHLMDPALVIKIEERSGSFANVVEWETWQMVARSYPRLQKWLAPCHAISPSGSVLLQRRVDPIRRSELPARVPACLVDLKQANWGVLEGHPVCIDYGLFAFDMSTRLERADWNE